MGTIALELTPGEARLVRDALGELSFWRYGANLRKLGRAVSLVVAMGLDAKTARASMRETQAAYDRQDSEALDKLAGVLEHPAAALGECVAIVRATGRTVDAGALEAEAVCWCEPCRARRYAIACQPATA